MTVHGNEIFGVPEHRQPGVLVAQVEWFIRRFCVLPDAAYLPLALWALATYIPNSFECFPYVALLSPTKRCGKTRGLETMELVAHLPWRGTSPSVAALFRMMEDVPVLLLDELEPLNRKGASETQQALLSVLNAGHRKGSTVPRCEPPKNKVKFFAVYGPKLFAAIGKLPDTLGDRSIIITMQRRTAAQPVERFLQSRAKADSEPIRNASGSFMREQAEAIQAAYEILMAKDLEYLADREAELWLPLFAVCAVAAPDRMSELQQCAKTLCDVKQANDADDSLSLKLLADLRTVWSNGQVRLETSVLLERLKEMEESPWRAEVPLTPHKLARLLRPFNVKPMKYREDQAGSLRGYSREALEEAWGRYLC